MGDHPSMRPPRETPPPNTPTETGSRSSFSLGQTSGIKTPIQPALKKAPPPGSDTFLRLCWMYFVKIVLCRSSAVANLINALC